MASNLMTLKELAEYLGVSEDKIIALVDEKIIVAYKIGGELLRFRREQIDAIRAEIESRIGKTEKTAKAKVPAPSRDRLRTMRFAGEDSSLKDRVVDFFYFNDFYIASGILILLLLFVIFKT